MQSEGIETNSRPSLFLCLSHGRVSVRSFPPKISIYGTCSHMGNPHPRIHYAASLLSVKYSYATYYSLVMYDTHDSKPVVYGMYTDSYGNCRPHRRRSWKNSILICRPASSRISVCRPALKCIVNRWAESVVMVKPVPVFYLAKKTSISVVWELLSENFIVVIEVIITRGTFGPPWTPPRADV